MSLEFKRRDYCYIDPFATVSVTYMGNILRVKDIKNVNKECPILRLPGNKIKNKRTGEIKECRPRIKNRSQGDISLGRTRRELMDLINTNCSEEKMKNCIFFTLTYKEVLQDTVKLYKDLDKFVKKFRYRYGKVEYIMLMAPQLKRKEWSWHIHGIFIFKSKAPFIHNDDLQELWGHGITNDRCKLYGKIDDIGRYLVSHLTNMPLDEVKKLGLPYDEKDIKEVEINYKTGEKEKVLIVKGIRTKYYPPKFNIKRCSRGLEQPKTEREHYWEVRKKVDYRRPTYCSTLQIIDEENEWSNTIKTEEYNLSRSCTVSKPTANDLKAINFFKEQQERDKSFKNLTEDDYDF